MPAQPKIPPDLIPALLKKHGETGWGGEKLAEWLKEEHGIEVGGRAVRAYIERDRKEKAPITAAAVAEAVAGKVTKNLDAVEQMLVGASTLYDKVGQLAEEIEFLKKVLRADITQMFDSTTGALLAFAKLPEDLRLVIHSLDSEQLFDGSGKDRYRSGDTVKVKPYDKERAVELLIRIRSMAAEERRQLLELQLKLAGAGSDDVAEVAAKRERLLKKLEAEEAAEA